MKRSVLSLLFLVAGITYITLAQGLVSASHTNDVWVDQLYNSKLFVAVHAFSPLVVWAVTDVGVIFKTTNGGTTWAPIDTVSCHVHDLVAIDDQKALLVGCGGDLVSRIFRTTNGGTRWDTVYTRSSATHITAMYMVDANNGIALGSADFNYIFVGLHTSTGGASWASILNPPVGGAIQDVSQGSLTGSGATHLWFVPTYQYGFFRSTDGGNAWTYETVKFDGPGPNPGIAQSLAFTDEDHGVLGLWDNSIAWSANGGETWTHEDLPGSGSVLSVAGYGVDFFAARGISIFRSTDRGHTWSTSFDQDHGTINKLSLVHSGNRLHVWAVSSLGAIEYTNLVTTDIEERESGIPANSALQQNYPNPFNPSTTIGFSVGGRETGPRAPRAGFQTTLCVYDLLGREVARLVDERKDPGYYRVAWDAGHMSSGVYLYRLTVGTFVQSREMIVIK